MSQASGQKRKQGLSLEAAIQLFLLIIVKTAAFFPSSSFRYVHRTADTTLLISLGEKVYTLSCSLTAS